MNFYPFVHVRPNGSEMSNPVPRTKHSQNFSHLSWIFLPVVLTKLLWGVLKFEIPIFNNFFPTVSNSPLCPMEKPKTSVIWKMRERRVKRSKGSDLQAGFNIYGYLSGYSMQSQFGVIRCTLYTMFQKYDSKKHQRLFPYICREIYHTSPELSSQLF